MKGQFHLIEDYLVPRLCTLTKPLVYFSLANILEAAQIAKSLDPYWMRAYLRESQAEGLKEYGDGAASYIEALKLDPSNKDKRKIR